MEYQWLAKCLEQNDRPWTKASFHQENDVLAIFRSSVRFVVSNGKDAAFWTTDWSGKGCIAWRWPSLYSYVRRSKLTVAQVVVNHRWVRDLQGALSDEAMGEFFQFWDDMQEIALHQHPDEIRWKLMLDEYYTAASAYKLFFMAREDCPHGDLLWHSRSPSRVRFFMWLVLKGRCVTADNLEKRHWPHDDTCPLCRWESEDCHQLFVRCTFTAAVWRLMRLWINVDFMIPGDEDSNLSDWWLNARLRFRPNYRGPFDNMFMLICWRIWKERNARIFDQRYKTPEALVEDIKEEAITWREAGIFPDCCE